MRRITKTAVWIGIGGILYVFLSHHFIYFGGKRFELIKKQKLTFHYTFYSASLKPNESILSIDALREAGIADLLVETGRMSEKERERLMARYESESY